MARTPLPTASRQPIFVLISRVLSHKLAYDARVSSHPDIQVHATQLDGLVQQALEAVMGRPLDARQMLKVHLPLELGCLGHALGNWSRVEGDWAQLVSVFILCSASHELDAFSRRRWERGQEFWGERSSRGKPDLALGLVDRQIC